MSLFIYNLLLYLIKHQIYFNIGDIQIITIITKLRIVKITFMRCDNHSKLAAPYSIIGSESDCWSRGCEFNPSLAPYFCGDCEIFSMAILLPLIQEGLVSVTSKIMCTQSTGLPLRLSLPRKCVVRLIYHLDMTIAFDLGL